MLVEIDDGHIGALARVQHRDRAPDARIAAGDDGRQPGQLAAAAIIGGEELRLELHRRLAAGLVELLGGKGAGGIIARPGLGVLGAALFGAALLGAGRFRLLVMRALLLLHVALLAAGLVGLVFRIAHRVLLELRETVWAKRGAATVRFFTQRGRWVGVWVKRKSYEFTLSG